MKGIFGYRDGKCVFEYTWAICFMDVYMQIHGPKKSWLYICPCILIYTGTVEQGKGVYRSGINRVPFNSGPYKPYI